MPAREFEQTGHASGEVDGFAFDAFVHFGDIKGESTDKDHKDWIMILQYSHEVTTPPAPEAG